MSPTELDALSVLLLWTAIAIYALAFIISAFDLAGRSQRAVEAKDAQLRVRELALAGGGSETAVASAPPAAPAKTGPNRVARVATAVMVLGFLFHLGAAVLRGLAAGRVPWANLYEFAMTGTLMIALVYLVVVLFVLDLRFLGVFINGIILVLLGGAALSFYVPVAGLPDSLKSVWLVIHIVVAALSVGLFALAAALSVTQLLQNYRASRPRARRSFLDALPSAATLEGYAYRFTIIGFVFWTFTLIAGSIWAQDAWGRYWGFDVKEVWTFIIWVLYAGYIHARATRGWRGNPSAILSIVGFAAVIFNMTVVNIAFKGLHAYSGL